MKKAMFVPICLLALFASPLTAGDHQHAFGFIANNFTYLNMGGDEASMTDSVGLQYRFSTTNNDIGFFSTLSLLTPLFGLDANTFSPFTYTADSFILDNSFGIAYSGIIEETVEKIDGEMPPLFHYLIGCGPNIKYIVLADNQEASYCNLMMFGIGFTLDFAMRLTKETRIGFVLDGTFDFLSTRPGTASSTSDPAALAASAQLSVYLRTNLF